MYELNYFIDRLLVFIAKGELRVNRAWNLGLYAELNGYLISYTGGSYHEEPYGGNGNIRYGMSVRCIKDSHP